MTENRMTLEQTIEWLSDAGVDETLGDEAFAWEEIITTTPAPRMEASRVSTSYLPQATMEACQKARLLCQEATNLAELKEKIMNFEGCSIKQTASTTVFGEGKQNPKIMLITEAPASDEDRYGKPFAGKNALLIDKMLQAIEIERDDCYFATILPWRPPGNRTPTESEISICLHFIKKQIELVSPQIIFFLGGSTANHLLEMSEPISKIRGKWFDYKVSKNQTIEALTSFNPEYILKNPEQKAKIWHDLLRIRKKIL
ncbi:MAG: uracil-DNA glycosylase [Alphaproteobacteria bacterium]|nr:uracil-DNA glycosylase [Alphaproteobacteria bacterium]